MISAIILVNTEMQSQEPALKGIKFIEGVEEAHALYGGVYELIVKIRASSFDGLKKIIKSGIRQVEGITSTLTLTLVEEPILRMRKITDSTETLSDHSYFEPIIINNL